MYMIYVVYTCLYAYVYIYIHRDKILGGCTKSSTTHWIRYYNDFEKPLHICQPLSTHIHVVNPTMSHPIYQALRVYDKSSHF